MKRVCHVVALVGIAVCVCVATFRAPIAAGEEKGVDFARDIRPILQERCIGCHGGVKRAGGLSLIGDGTIGLAGDSGQPLIVPGNADESELMRRVVSSDAAERMPAEGPPLTPSEIAKLRRWIDDGAAWPLHWSFAPLANVAPSEVNDAAWPRSPIDPFVLRRLESVGAAPSPEANRYTLVRRLSLDLLGLPPDPSEADAFVAECAPDAYERLVDRLLANPHFGERWGRHWLDLARYADSDGYEVDKARPDAYRWRDWVIEAINRDLPLDQFTIEQFAGDMLPEATPFQHLATAYHRQTLTNNEGGVDKEEYRLKAVLDRISNTGTVWLGLTLGCAQCHDHPYDPITQREFYALAAIFNNADEAEIELAGGKFRVLTERSTPRATRILNRGEFLNPGEEVQPAVLAALHALPARSADRPPGRLDLARWIVDPANPLTPRVMVNQIWLRLFGQGLVRSAEDFGARGQAPLHPELLDWLARELLLDGWSRKALVRKVVASAAYRQESHQRRDLAAIDPLNRLLGRQNRIRVEAEIVRDLHLAAGGLLSGRIGGPSVFPPLGKEFTKITFRSELAWKTSQGEDRYRRGMYTFFKRTVPYPDLMVFDCPDASAAAAERTRSNTPLQALTLLNSETCLEAARGLARQVLSAPLEDDRSAVRAMFRACLARPPDERELARATKLHQEHRSWYRSHSQDAQSLAGEPAPLAGAVPEMAALVATANVIMNLDEFITRE